MCLPQFSCPPSRMIWLEPRPSVWKCSVLTPPGAQVLLDAGFVTVCAGGGGVPVAVEEVADGRVQRRRHGIEAVIDKARPLPGPVCHVCTCGASSAACPLDRSCKSEVMEGCAYSSHGAVNA